MSNFVFKDTFWLGPSSQTKLVSGKPGSNAEHNNGGLFRIAFCKLLMQYSSALLNFYGVFLFTIFTKKVFAKLLLKCLTYVCGIIKAKFPNVHVFQEYTKTVRYLRKRAQTWSSFCVLKKTSCRVKRWDFKWHARKFCCSSVGTLQLYEIRTDMKTQYRTSWVCKWQWIQIYALDLQAYFYENCENTSSSLNWKWYVCP